MRIGKTKLIILLIVCGILAARGQFPAPALNHALAREEASIVQREEISYSVRWRGIKIGTATASFLGETILKGLPAYLLTLRVRLATFSDDERIYSDPKTFYPIRVERSLSMGGEPLEILEEYDQEAATLKLTRFREGRREEESIKSCSRMQNAILLFFQCRYQDLNVGDSYPIVLPTSKYEINVVREEEIDTPLGKYNAFVLETNPKKISFWIDTDKRIPLKMQKSLVLGHLTMMVTNIKEMD